MCTRRYVHTCPQMAIHTCTFTQIRAYSRNAHVCSTRVWVRPRVSTCTCVPLQTPHTCTATGTYMRVQTPGWLGAALAHRTQGGRSHTRSCSLLGEVPHIRAPGRRVWMQQGAALLSPRDTGGRRQGAVTCGHRLQGTWAWPPGPSSSCSRLSSSSDGDPRVRWCPVLHPEGGWGPLPTAGPGPAGQLSL